MPPTLRPYQRDALAFMQRYQRTIYGDGPGTGKTPTATRLHPHVVVAPKSVLRMWGERLVEWGAGTPFLAVGTPKQRALMYETATQATPLVLSYETMRQDIEQVRRLDVGVLVFDEAHRLKNRKAAVRKAAAKLTRRPEIVAMLTGTPILNHPEELWSALNLLYPTKFPSYWRWVHEHYHVKVTDFRGRLARPVTIVGDLLPGHEPILQADLSGVLIQRPLALLLPDMPPVSTTRLTVDLTPDERKHYQQMLKFDWTAIGDEPTVAANDVSRISRLRQLASDWTALGATTPGTKARAAAELAADIGEPVVIFTAYRATAVAVAGLVGAAAVYTGEQSAEEREQAVRSFVSGDVSVLVGTIGALSEGVDGLQAVSRHIIFVDRDWTPARNEQAIGRIRRSGQQSGVQVWNIVARDTVDEDVEAALASKESVIEAVLGTLEASR
jgi:SNF2 family DNA or RNA helicase